MKFIVIGLGNFGSSLSHRLTSLGHEVIGVDQKLEHAEKYKNQITHTMALDATNPEAIKQLPMKDVDAAIISIGEDEGAAIMTTALLKQMQVKRIICRVTSPLQKMVLETMNITEFVYPESSSAERLAFKLDLPGVINSFQVTEDYRLLEVAAPSRYIGSRISDLDLGKRYELVLVTIMKDVVEKNVFGNNKTAHKVMGIISPDTVLVEGDILLLFGAPVNLESFIES
ncbi:MAG: TrkA family potassium uptake protein [Chitinophagaceae bacterium]|jgi:trk system potassium uptake protein TrkA|nr:TrkA family potassium uptake protein [Chitinophagaceae bacterium]